MTIIALSGFARSGKDSVAAFLVRHHGFSQLAFAGPLKAIALGLDSSIAITADEQDRFDLRHSRLRLSRIIEMFGPETAKDIKGVREFYQAIGELNRQHLYEDVWIDATLRRAEALDRCVISDARYINEAESVRALGGAIIRINRPGVGPANQHASETELTNYDFDAVIENDGTSLSGLGDKVEKALAEVGIL